MKAVILAGGLGTRLSEETGIRPKPMVEIGDQPILWHILKIYSHYGINDFIICCGYKSYVIKEYFRDYMLRRSNTMIDLASGTVSFENAQCEPWRISLIETGDNSMTGGRLKKVAQYLGDETFFMTYGDGLSSVNLTEALAFHKAHGKLATLTAVQPPGRFGVFSLPKDDPFIRSYTEKPKGDGSWINGGFFVLEPKVIDYIDGFDTIWERDPMRRLAHDGQLAAYRHDGFWHAMDTLQDKTALVSMWTSGAAPWKVWS